jgi:hypothetical protein
MSILAFPAILAPSGVSWRLRALIQTHESPFDGSAQTLALPGARWGASVVWQSLRPAQARVMEAFLAQMAGRAGRFTFGPPHGPRQAVGTGAPVVNGTGQVGDLLSIRGWVADAQAFLVGDWLSFLDDVGRRRLHQVTADAVADGDGIASVQIAPPLRRSPPDGAPVEITAPLGVFKLAEDAPAISVRPPLLGSVTLEIEEALV